MIEVRAPLPGDIATIGKTAAESWVRESCAAGADFSGIVNRPHTNVATIDGIPVAAGGFIDRGQGNAIAWSLVGEIPQMQFVALCRIFHRHMIATPFQWIEAHCFETFQQSHRWVRCLGFTLVRGERCFTPDGREFRKFVFRNDHDGN